MCVCVCVGGGRGGGGWVGVGVGGRGVAGGVAPGPTSSVRGRMVSPACAPLGEYA